MTARKEHGYRDRHLGRRRGDPLRQHLQHQKQHQPHRERLGIDRVPGAGGPEAADELADANEHDDQHEPDEADAQGHHAEHRRRDHDRGHDAGRADHRLSRRGIRAARRGERQLAEPAKLLDEPGPVFGADHLGGPYRGLLGIVVPGDLRIELVQEALDGRLPLAQLDRLSHRRRGDEHIERPQLVPGFGDADEIRGHDDGPLPLTDRPRVQDKAGALVDRRRIHGEEGRVRQPHHVLRLELHHGQPDRVLVVRIRRRGPHAIHDRGDQDRGDDDQPRRHRPSRGRSAPIRQHETHRLERGLPRGRLHLLSETVPIQHR
ncbi:MAG: hypothetical protein ACYTEI_14870 [Planctomycetota bacterium]|jgi:hypothetical protein